MMKSFFLTLILMVVLFQHSAQADFSTSIADRNTSFGIYVLQNADPTIQLTDSLEAIQKQRNASNEIRSALIKSINSSLMGFAQIISSELQNGSEFNLHVQELKAVSVLTENLKKNLSNIQVKAAHRFQIMLAPKLSDKTYARKQGAPLVSALYPSDRSLIVEILPDVEDAYPQAHQVMNGNVYAAITRQLQTQFESQTTDQPKFLSLAIRVDLDPDPEKSQISSQFVVAMPVNIEREFTKENDEIKFTQIVFPRFKMNSLSNFSAQEYPVAFVNMTQSLLANDAMMNLQFGPLGTYQNGQWQRVPGKDFTQYVPKLRGTPKTKGALNGIAQQAQVDFNIFNIDTSVATQEVTNINLYLSVGLNKYPNLKYGAINSEKVDSQFKDEINKTIQQQKEDLKNRLTSPDEQKSVAQELIQSLLERKKKK